MKQLLNYGCLALLALALIACSSQIDASTEASLETSTAKVKASLAEDSQAEFDEALTRIIYEQIDKEDIEADDNQALHAKLKIAIHDKTAKDIMAEGKRLKEQQIAAQKERAEQKIKDDEAAKLRTEEREKAFKAREKAEALKEIQDLEAKRAKDDANRKELEKFEVSNATFEMQRDYFGSKMPSIQLSVKNGTDQVISHAFFVGTLASPNRTLPWHKDSFNYSIRGGLEAGETAKWSLQPNMFSDWARVDAPDDAVLTVTVEKLNGANDQNLYPIDHLSEEDAKRLEQLKAKYGQP